MSIAMPVRTRVQLSFMMFLEFFIWGGWFVTMGTYLTQTLSASDVENGMAYGTQSWGAIIAPFIIGLIADRYFSAQRILGVLHLLGAGLLYYLSIAENFESFYPAVLAYMIVYMPTLALVNTVAFKQLSDSESQFAAIRVWGTLGWIVAGLIIGWVAWEQDGLLSNTFKMTAVVSAILGVYSFTLPNTPPPKAGTKTSLSEIVGWESIKLLKDRNFFIFFISSFLICIPLAFYYQETNKFLNEVGVQGAAAKMSMGQMSEMLFMVLMPFFFKRLGVKKMLLFGMLAWIVRYLMFGFGDAENGIWLLYGGIILHGICYDFFFVTGQIYTDNRAGEKIRASAQGMITLATYGVGMLIGFWIAGKVSTYYKLAEGHAWKEIWMVPAGIAAIVMLIFMIFFRDDEQTETELIEIPKLAVG
jgi:nucleoside transporter